MTNNIRALRKAAGMIMKQLGNLMGVSESTISLYENGKAEPDIAMLRKIADCFGVTIDYLLTDNPKDTKKPTCHTVAHRFHAHFLLLPHACRVTIRFALATSIACALMFFSATVTQHPRGTSTNAEAETLK